MSKTILAVPVAALLLTAQQPDPPRAQAPAAQTGSEEKCSIEGVVVNARTGEPLKKAQIVLFRAQPQDSMGMSVGAMTDAAGRFRVTGLEPGQYRISATRNGFSRPDPTRREPGQPPPLLTLAPGQKVTELKFKLEPAAVISGRVLDEDGEPLVNARLQALRGRYVQGKRQWMPAGMANTDDLGQFRLHSLPPGRYYVKAWYADMRAQFGIGGVGGQTQDETYAPVYYPGVMDASQAVPVTVREGEEKRAIDFRLSPVRAARIRGKVTGTPSSTRAMLTLMPRGQGAVMIDRPVFARVQADGKFEMAGVTPGSYALTAMLEQDGERLTGRRELEVGEANIEGVEVHLRPAGEVSGSVRVENESEPKADLKALRIALAPEEMAMYGYASGPVQSDGAFTLKGASDGAFRVNVSGLPKSHYVSRIRFGNDDVTDKALVIGEGSGGGTLEITVSGDSGTVEGTVTDKDRKVLSASNVVLLPARKGVRANLFATTDQNGRFTIGGIRPGEYTAYAFDGAEQGAWEDPDFLGPLKDRGKTVTVDPRGKQSLELEAIPVKSQE